MQKTKRSLRQPLSNYCLSAGTLLRPQFVCWISGQKISSLRSSNCSAFSHTLLLGISLSDTLRSMSTSTLLSSAASHFMNPPIPLCNQIQRTKSWYFLIQLQVPSSHTHVPFILQKYLKRRHFWVSFGDFILVFFSTIFLQVLGPILF